MEIALALALTIYILSSCDTRASIIERAKLMCCPFIAPCILLSFLGVGWGRCMGLLRLGCCGFGGLSNLFCSVLLYRVLLGLSEIEVVCCTVWYTECDVGCGFKCRAPGIVERASFITPIRSKRQFGHSCPPRREYLSGAVFQDKWLHRAMAAVGKMSLLRCRCFGIFQNE